MNIIAQKTSIIGQSPEGLGPLPPLCFQELERERWLRSWNAVSGKGQQKEPLILND